MKKIFLIIVSMLMFIPVYGSQTTRQERKLISEGNKFYREGNYGSAIEAYSRAIELNPTNEISLYNFGMAQILHGNDAKEAKSGEPASQNDVRQTGIDNLRKVAQMGNINPGVADKANYNLGNLAFNSQNYQEAVDYYKNALRINPDNDNARRNLRIAQKKLQNSKNQDKDQNKDKDENKDQDKEDQDKDKNKDQDKEQDKDNKENQPQDQKEEKINPQAAAQILQAVENKENAKRNSMKSLGEKSDNNSRRRQKNW